MCILLRLPAQHPTPPMRGNAGAHRACGCAVPLKAKPRTEVAAVGAGRRELRQFYHLLPATPTWHIHLLLASPCAAAGNSHSIMGIHSVTVLFTLPTCLCLWSGKVAFSPASPLEAQTLCKVSLHLCWSPILCCFPTVLNFWPVFQQQPPWWLVVPPIFCISEGQKVTTFISVVQLLG